jgi:hypothetical protein
MGYVRRNKLDQYVEVGSLWIDAGQWSTRRVLMILRVRQVCRLGTIRVSLKESMLNGWGDVIDRGKGLWR